MSLVRGVLSDFKHCLFYCFRLTGEKYVMEYVTEISTGFHKANFITPANITVYLLTEWEVCRGKYLSEFFVQSDERGSTPKTNTFP